MREAHETAHAPCHEARCQPGGVEPRATCKHIARGPPYELFRTGVKALRPEDTQPRRTNHDLPSIRTNSKIATTINIHVSIANDTPDSSAPLRATPELSAAQVPVYQRTVNTTILDRHGIQE